MLVPLVFLCSLWLLIFETPTMNCIDFRIKTREYFVSNDNEDQRKNVSSGVNDTVPQIDITDFVYQDEGILVKDILYEQNGTDSGMYNEDLFEGDILLQDPEGKNAVKNGNKLWPNAAIVFKTADDVGCPDSRQCKILMHAMDVYHKKTCIRFKEWTGERDFVEIFYNKGNSGACWSGVGRNGGLQRLSLGYRCWYLGIAIHELGHAVGFWHEMNRPDRDQHIIIHWRNILPGFASSFIKNSPSTVSTLGEPFDLKSIMMYDEYAFSKDGRSQTIETKSRATIGPIWRKRGLSDSDIRRIHKLYNCDGSKVKDGFPYNFKCDFSENTCGFRNRGKLLWKWRAAPKSRGYIFAAGNQTSSNSQLVSANFHPVEETNSDDLGCLAFSYFLSGSSTIKVKQEVLSSVIDLRQGFGTDLWISNNSKEGWENVQTSIDLSKPHRVVFEPSFTVNGVVAINNVKMTIEKCFNSNKVI